MKQRVIAIILIAVMCTALFSGCQAEPSAQETATQQEKVLYAPNVYRADKFYFQKHFWVNYGTVLKDVEYYSQTAGETKRCNILLPAHYSERKQYPVLYVLHGFYGSAADHIDEQSYLTVLYGNLLFTKKAKEMIIVSVEMYTDKARLEHRKSQEQMHFIYNKVIEDIYFDVMPFIESNYPVKTGRENTAVAGVSEGGAKALCIGFRRPEQFAYIGAFAPNPGVIPTEFYRGSYWDKTYFKTFPLLSEENAFEYLYLAVGSKDETNAGVTMAYREALDSCGVKNQTDYVKGCGHNMKFWKLCFYNYLQKVFR
ncbi:MAG: hypothetical protein E7517_05845 [Ruminococcaceae bacterium]|nr:hypothetical protein [Oscillospiraceae bacterium]